MSKKTNHKATENNMDSSSKIEAIKNLIFGENIEQYNSEFETLKQDIDQKRSQLQDYIDQVREELMQAIDNLGTDVNIRITDLQDQLEDKTESLESRKVNKQELGEMLIALGEKITKQ